MAVETVAAFLESNDQPVSVIFCTFDDNATEAAHAALSAAA